MTFIREYCPFHDHRTYAIYAIAGVSGYTQQFVKKICTNCIVLRTQQNERYTEQHRHELWLELIP